MGAGSLVSSDRRKSLLELRVDRSNRVEARPSCCTRPRHGQMHLYIVKNRVKSTKCRQVCPYPRSGIPPYGPRHKCFAPKHSPPDFGSLVFFFLRPPTPPICFSFSVRPFAPHSPHVFQTMISLLFVTYGDVRQGIEKRNTLVNIVQSCCALAIA